jgi:hypothetical protein
MKSMAGVSAMMRSAGYKISNLNSKRVFSRSGFKTPSEAQWLCCPADWNTHVLTCTLRFQSAGRLALEPDLRF